MFNRLGFLVFLSSASLLTLVQAQICADGWQDILGRCYLPVDNPGVRGNTAARRLYCLQRGGDLAKFDPPEDYENILPNLFTFPEYYIGLTDVSQEGLFLWIIDNSVPTSTTWNTFQPGGGINENCVTVSGNPAVWSDTSCNRQLPFICSRPLENPSCGTGPFTNRIVGGVESTEGVWPWQGSLRFNMFYSHGCGATLISEEWAITAAHCSGLNYVVFGDISVANPIAATDQGSYVTWFPHPLYRSELQDYDIALLRLHTPVTISDTVRPACIYRSDATAAQDTNPPELTELFNCFITGWGTLSEDGPSPDILNEAPISILPPARCANYGPSFISRIMLCAGNNDFTIDSCQGDSGGPLICQDTVNGLWRLTGVVSFGRGCARIDFPGVYTRIATTNSFSDDTRRIGSSLFKCPDGQVLLSKQACNNIVDCFDASDELGCDPLPAGASLELTSPKFGLVTNFIYREWIYYPDPNELLIITFTVNNLFNLDNLSYELSRSEGLIPVPNVTPTGIEFTIQGSGPGSPIIVLMDKTTPGVIAGFQAFIRSF